MFDFLKLAPTALGACSQKGKSAISYTITATYFGTDFLVVFFIRKWKRNPKNTVITLSNGTDRQKVMGIDISFFFFLSSPKHIEQNTSLFLSKFSYIFMVKSY